MIVVETAHLLTRFSDMDDEELRDLLDEAEEDEVIEAIERELARRAAVRSVRPSGRRILFYTLLWIFIALATAWSIWAVAA